MSHRYPDVPGTRDLEAEVAALWSEEDTFRRSLERTADGTPFVFYEGPPTANGRPGIHHIMSRTIKDSVARFQTMRGRYVHRMAGWDTHGLPVEIEAEKRLGISGKKDIEAIGIERFNEVCRESVLTYTEEWERFSARIGYWLDYSAPYVTFRPEYIESVWSVLKAIADRGLIYRGHKILPYCPRCGTGLSSHEVAQGYQDIDDPSLYFTLPLEENPSRKLLVWTTTPWTVVSNVAVAIDAELEYAEVRRDEATYILAAERVEAVFGGDAEVVARMPGSELAGARYRRPFEWVQPDTDSDAAWTVLPADFVSAEDGTGIVHMAPAFGADDYEMGRRHDLPVLLPVDDRGRFREEVPEVGGQFVKDADDRLVELLRERGALFRITRETHSYPHCWRCRSPLLYLARDSWFIRTTEVREDLLRNNDQVAWHPPEIGTGRFGEWLENNVDWALSRNRYWGTPLPVWVCDEDPECLEFIGSFAELRERVPDLEADFDPHRPFIDELTWSCRREGCGGTMRRTPEVIDVWFDSGSMPYAQWHYPFENEEELERQFPADFISEGVDQTRGWFYSMMAISTLLGRGPAYRNVIVNGLLLDAEGQKMSKSRGNVVDPWAATDEHGADAIRWYLLSASHPWLPKRFDPEGVREVDRKVFDTLRNSYRFFAMYARLEGWTPEEGGGDGGDAVMDRWLRSRVRSTADRVSREMEAYNLTHAVRAVAELIDDLSNWYVRRSRDRFWGGRGSEDDGGDAFAALHAALVAISRMMASFAPFLADWMHRALTGKSAHLASFPESGPGGEETLEAGMDAVRRLATLGRAARETAGIRVRQPLGRMLAVVPTGVLPDERLLEILRDELNVKEIEFPGRAERIVHLSARPNFRALGSRFQKRTPRVAEAIRAIPAEVLAESEEGARPLRVTVDGEEVEIGEGEYEIVREAQGDYLMESEGGYTVALDPTVTPALRAEGLAREVINRVQRLRKDSGFAVDDRIRLAVSGSGELLEKLAAHEELIAGETLATEIETVTDGIDESGYEVVREVALDEHAARIGVARVGAAAEAGS